MTKTEIRAAVVAAIQDVERRCGRNVQTMPSKTRPVTDLMGWDSLLGVEATFIVEQKLGKELSVESIFVTDTNQPKARSIDEIVNMLFKTFSSEYAA